jgi:hypothetical protein
MSTKREIIDRPRQHRFSQETLDLFRRLESIPKRLRDKAWRDETIVLNRMVDLSARSTGALALWGNLLDISDMPDDGPGTLARADREICIEMRKALLEAIKAADKAAGEPPA